MHLRMLRFSCTARDVHLLRGLTKDVVMPAAEYYDRYIKATVAGFLKLKVDDSEELWLILDERMGHAPGFVTAWPQVVLPFSA